MPDAVGEWRSAVARDTLPPGSQRPARYEFEYERGGTLACIAPWDVHHANLFDRVEPRTRSSGNSNSAGSNSIVLFWVLLRVVVDMAISFAHAYTDPWTVPSSGIRAKACLSVAPRHAPEARPPGIIAA